jgi:hypothetical protein
LPLEPSTATHGIRHRYTGRHDDALLCCLPERSAERLGTARWKASPNMIRREEIATVGELPDYRDSFVKQVRIRLTHRLKASVACSLREASSITIEVVLLGDTHVASPRLRALAERAANRIM